MPCGACSGGSSWKDSGRSMAAPMSRTFSCWSRDCGLGVATLVPAAMHTADGLPGLPRGVGLTVVSWLLRVGFLLSPPVVGLIADLASLRVGLLSVVFAGIVTVVLGRGLLNRTI